MQLVKLVYISHGWYLGLTGKPLINEAVEAWKYGPVIPSIYHSFKKYGNNSITEQELDIVGFSYVNTEIKDLNKMRFLDKVWDVYKQFNGPQLSTLTHENGTPWFITWHNNGGQHQKSVTIPNDLIKDHYLIKIKSVKKD